MPSGIPCQKSIEQMPATLNTSEKARKYHFLPRKSMFALRKNSTLRLHPSHCSCRGRCPHLPGRALLDKLLGELRSPAPDEGVWAYMFKYSMLRRLLSGSKSNQKSLLKQKPL